MVEQALSFEDFQLFPTQRVLLRSGTPLRLGSRALDLLIALLEHPGEVVGKEHLIAQVWPNTFVEESSLRVHVAALRKALNDDQLASHFIRNVPGRGYSFVAPVTRQRPQAQPSARPAEAPLLRNFPVTIARVIGRDEVLGVLAAQLPQQRLLSIVGTGGIGKTTVTLALARAVASAYRDGVAFVDLASVTDPQLVPSAVASVLGQAIHSENAVPELVAILRDREILIVLDGCEHLVEISALLAETLLKSAPGVHILASSREPLRADGEWVYRLPPLNVPPEAMSLTAEEALRFSAVRMFTERAAACLGGYELSDDDAPVVVEICRQLDGVALAIELAAGRVYTIGIAGLANSLNDRFRVLTRGRRTALPRHQTLRATLDWSYNLLPPSEQLILRRLGVFNGAFALDAVRAVAVDDDTSLADVEDGLSNLFDKSLMTADVGSGGVHYRLLDTTRAYCREKLDESGEGQTVRRRHAQYFQTLYEKAEAEWESRPTSEWLEDYAGHIGNLRAALDWAFAPEGDPAIGVALTVAAVPFWFALLLADECLSRVQRALAYLDTTPSQGGRRRMRLQAALGWPQMRAISGMKCGRDAWKTTLELAEALGDVDYQLRALWALWVDQMNSGEPRKALALADRFGLLAASCAEATDCRIGERMRAKSQHVLGDQVGARKLTQHMLDSYVPPINRSHLVRFQYDQEITARITLARVLWVQGFPDQALREVEGCICRATALKHILSLSHVLSDAACPIALLCGDLVAADRYTDTLLELTSAHSLDVWETYGEFFAGELLARRGQIEAGLAAMRSAIGQLERSNFILYRTASLHAIASSHLRLGQSDAALNAIETALAQCEQTGEGWLVADLHRVRGEILLRQDARQVEAAEGAFRRALDIARSQGALSWELRAATSLAELWRSRDRAAEAEALLAPVYARLSEGFTTEGPIAAAGLLDRLRRS